MASSLITTALTLINPYDDFGVADLAEIPLYMQFGLVMIAVNTLIDGGARWHYEANTPEFHIQSASTHTTH